MRNKTMATGVLIISLLVNTILLDGLKQIGVKAEEPAKEIMIKAANFEGQGEITNTTSQVTVTSTAPSQATAVPTSTPGGTVGGTATPTPAAQKTIADPNPASIPKPIIPPNPEQINRVMVNGSILNIDTPPQMIEGRLLVPLRAIFEAIGAQVEWNEDVQAVTGTIGENNIRIQIDNKTAKVNGMDKILDVAATVINGRTMVPVRFISESLGAKVSWDEKTSTAVISTVFMDKTDLFGEVASKYGLCRIPGVVVTKNNVVLAYCEARKTSEDLSEMDIIMSRSLDGGESWEPVQMLVEGMASGKTMNNPVMIVDNRTNVIHFLYCKEYHQAYYMQSTDEGKTWSEPVEITQAFRESTYPWKVIATGPGHGIQLKNGRLLVPIWMANGYTDTTHSPSVTSTLYSDDYGKTWHCGEVINETAEIPNPNESTAVQMEDNRVMLNMRNTATTLRRGVVVSPDGISNWSLPRFDDNLPDPKCFGSIIRYSEQSSEGANIILFSNPNHESKRNNLSLRYSEDEGNTWKYTKTLELKGSSYSDLAVGPDKTVYVFYERAYQRLTMARLNLNWIKQTDSAVTSR